MWKNKPFVDTIQDFFKKENIDYLAPFEMVNCNSVADFLICNPNSLSMMMDVEEKTITKKMSLIEQFGKGMKFNETGNSKQLYDYYPDLLNSLPENKCWIRKPKTLIEDLLLSNPLWKTITLNKDVQDKEKEGIMGIFKRSSLDEGSKYFKKTAVSCNLLIEAVMNSGCNYVNYNRLM